MRIVITGATGYIGRRVTSAAVARDWEVVAASRSRPTGADMAWIPYRLEDDPDPSGFPRESTILHLAAETRGEAEGLEQREVVAVQRLLEIARRRRMRMVFVSSQAARHDAPTAYGRAKWQIEQEVLRAGGTVVRPGLVYGGPPGGLFLRLLEQVRKQLVLPALLPAPQVQPVHVDDLVEGLLRIIERDDVPGQVFQIAAARTISFTRFLRTVAVVRLRRRRVFVPFPTALLQPVLGVASAILGKTYEADRARSLADLSPMQCEADLAALGLELRPFASGMNRSGSDRRRRLLREGWAFISYVLGEAASPALIRRYGRAVERLRDGQPVRIPALVLANPGWVAVLDDNSLLHSAEASEIIWRLDAATALAEASPTGARSFLAIGHSSGKLHAMFALVAVALSETYWRSVRFVIAPFLRRSLVGAHGND